MLLGMSSVLYWPSSIATHVPIWRLCDLSGLTPSQRHSYIALRAGTVYINNRLVTREREKVKVGDRYTLEIRDSKGKTKSITFDLRNKIPVRGSRSNEDFSVNRQP